MNFRKRILFLLVLVLPPLVILSTGCSATKSASNARAENASIAPSNENEPDLPASPAIANNATEPLATYEKEAAPAETVSALFQLTKTLSHRHNKLTSTPIPTFCSIHI